MGRLRVTDKGRTKWERRKEGTGKREKEDRKWTKRNKLHVRPGHDELRIEI